MKTIDERVQKLMLRVQPLIEGFVTNSMFEESLRGTLEELARDQLQACADAVRDITGPNFAAHEAVKGAAIERYAPAPPKKRVKKQGTV